jgi:hypothetical protein
MKINRRKFTGHLVGAAALLAGLAPTAKATGIAFVQSANSVGTTSPSVTFGSNNTAGNLLILVSRMTTATAHTVSDTQGNTWVSAIAFLGVPSQGNYVFWYALNCFGGANTVTLGSANFYQTIVAEYSGVTGVTGTPASININTNTTTPSVGPITPATTNNLVVAMFANEDSNSTVYSSPGGGFTLRPDDGCTIIMDLIQTSATTATASLTSSVAFNEGGGIIVAFSAPGGSVTSQIGGFLVGP